MKTRKHKKTGWGLFFLVTATLVLHGFLSVAAMAADNPMLHNSNRFPLTTKHGGTWGLPGTKYGEFDCGTCHAKNTGNIKRIKKAFVAPNSPVDQFPAEVAPPAGGINFQDAREGFSDFGDDARAVNTESTNICEACHTYDPAQLVGVKFHGYDMSSLGDSGHYNKADCMICHPHSQGFKPQACDSCHGYPPIDTSAGGTTGLANNPYSTGSATAGAHQKHAIDLGYACTNCHDSYNMPQESTVKTGFGDISIGFNNFSVTTGSYTGQAGVSYNDVFGTGGETCSTVYCHSNGQSADGTSATPSAYSTPSWSGTAACGTCHSATDLATGSHTAHISDGALCNDCHSANNHVDHNIDVTSGTYTAGGAPGNGYGSCSTASCHDDGTGTLATTPNWGTTSACGECHAAAPGTGAHTKHFTAATVLIGAMVCADCHGDAVQAVSAVTGQHGVDGDGNLDIFDTLAGDLGYAANVATTAPLYNTQTCNTSYCHGDSMPGGTTSGTTNAPTWGTTNGVGCTFCHDMAPLAIGAHAGKALTDCITCHGAGAGNINATGTGFTNGGITHINGTVEVNADSCTSCHVGDIDGVLTGAHGSHTDTATFLSGKSVSGGSYGGAGWYTTTYVNGKPIFGCGECHPAAEGVSHPTAGLNIDLDPAGEIPTVGSLKLKNVAGPTNPALNSRVSVTCSNIYCHSDAAVAPAYATTPDWYGGAVSGNCNDCHANGPTSGTHANHVVGIHYETLYNGTSGLAASSGIAGSGAAHGDAATADTIGCQSCHNNTVAVEYNSTNSVCTGCHLGGTGSPATGNEKMVVNPLGATHVNGTADVVFDNFASFKSKAQIRDDITTAAELNTNWTRTNGYKASTSFDQAKVATPSYAGGSCSNVSCHNGIATPTWNTGFAGNCRACHTTLP